MSFPRPSSSKASTSRSHSQSQGNSQSKMNETIEKLALKADYMTLLDEVNAIVEPENVLQTIDQINNVVDRAEELFPKVNDTTEMYLDAKIMQSATATLEQTTNNVDVGEGNFRLFVFAEQLKAKARGEGGRPSWEALAAVAEPVVQNSIPTWSPLLGSFEFTAEVSTSQQKKVRQQRQKDVEAEKKEPEKLSQVDKPKKGVGEIVQEIYSKLKRHYRKNDNQPINYFRFVVNPTNFAATIENIFHVSFLINDGNAKLELDGEEPLISPLSKGKENSNPTQESQSRERKQNIISMDMETWQELILVLQINKAMI